MPAQTFNKIRTTKRHLQIAEQILEQIRSGKLGVGDQLPPERELAAQMGVSRPSVREALIALELLDVVDIRIGQGTYVIADARSRAFAAALKYLGGSVAPPPFELAEARAVIECATVLVGTEQVGTDPDGPAKLQAVIEIHQAMQQLVGDDSQAEQFARLGARFHPTLAACSGNEVLEDIIGQLAGTTEDALWRHIYQKVIAQDRQARQSQIDEHEQILAAVQRGDGPAAALALRQHLTHVTELALQ